MKKLLLITTLLFASSVYADKIVVKEDVSIIKYEGEYFLDDKSCDEVMKLFKCDDINKPSICYSFKKGDVLEGEALKVFLLP